MKALVITAVLILLLSIIFNRVFWGNRVDTDRVDNEISELVFDYEDDDEEVFPIFEDICYKR